MGLASLGLAIGIFCDSLYSVLLLSTILGLNFLGLALSQSQLPCANGPRPGQVFWAGMGAAAAGQACCLACGAGWLACNRIQSHFKAKSERSYVPSSTGARHMPRTDTALPSTSPRSPWRGGVDACAAAQKALRFVWTWGVLPYLPGLGPPWPTHPAVSRGNAPRGWLVTRSDQVGGRRLYGGGTASAHCQPS
jgi:hypothetical protein